MILKTKKQKLIIIFILILICVFLIFLLSSKNNKPINGNSSPEEPLPRLPLAKGEEKGGGPVFLEINNKKYETQIVEGESVFDFMKKLKAEGKITFESKKYPGMGEFIESINGIKNGEQNWIYYVNGEKANIGISNYKLKSGDTIKWEYEK